MHFQEHKVKKIKHSPESAWPAIQTWCAYQERSQYETRLKLMAYGLSPEQSDELVARLISENFLNEERFALAFAGGKFRIKHWGRNKIRAELRKHQVSERNMRTALTAIGDEDYLKTIRHLIDKKIPKPGTDRRKDFYGTLRYLVGRGFESDLVTDALNLKLERNNDESRS